MFRITIDLVHKLHQTRLSRLIRRLPFVGRAAHVWWIREQFTLARGALENLPRPIRVSSHSRLAMWVPNAMRFSEPDGELLQLGRNFSEAMRNFESHKFHQLGYQYVYGSLLRAFENKPVRLLEVGIGTTDSRIPSSMSGSYVPGTSLRAWKHYFGSAEIHGADIDRSLCVDTEGYAGHWVDQRSKESLARLSKDLGPAPFDLIIDDGLHTPEANAKTMAALLPLLSQDGFYIVEDILINYDQVWSKLVEFLGEKGYEATYYSGEILNHVSEISPTEGLLVVYRK